MFIAATCLGHPPSFPPSLQAHGSFTERRPELHGCKQSPLCRRQGRDGRLTWLGRSEQVSVSSAEARHQHGVQKEEKSVSVQTLAKDFYLRKHNSHLLWMSSYL